MSPETQTQMEPPRNGGTVVACGFADDDIEEIAAKIANLNPVQTIELIRYLRSKGIEL